MDDNPQYEKKRWIHFGACALNTILVVITVIVLCNTDDNSPFSEYSLGLMPGRVVSYLIIFIGIESIGMFGAYFEHSSLTANYICMYIFKIIAIFSILYDWVYILSVVFSFNVVSFITSILFLVSLSDELQFRQFNQMYSIQYSASPPAFSSVHSVQSAFRPPPRQSFVQTPLVQTTDQILQPFVQELPDNFSVQPLPKNPLVQPSPGQSTDQELKPLPLHHYHPILPLTNDQSPSQVILNVTEMTATTSGPAEPKPPMYEEFKSDAS